MIINDIQCVEVDASLSSKALKLAIKEIEGEYFFLKTCLAEIDWLPGAVDRMLQVADFVNANMIYSNYIDVEKDSVLHNHPVCDYQMGSLRDDFDFGPIVLVKTNPAREIISEMPDYDYSAFYALRLALSAMSENGIFRIDEFLYTSKKTDYRNSGERQFDYVLQDKQKMQKEYELVCTRFLESVSAIDHKLPQCILDNALFDMEASIIIPVKDRIQTIEDALLSALSQKTDFKYNIIVVDNHSTDGTTAIINKLSAIHPNIVHIVPAVKGLGIGGCWNEAINHSKCGRYAVQLDSDDLYQDENTLQAMVDKFRQDGSAMVIGSYTMVDFDLNILPPGLIAHREWTDSNGRNNALRINGFGAPRAFYVPLLRTIQFPNVSYGEDYAVALAVSRQWKVSRIYESLYLCRRWFNNSDAKLSIEKENANNYYKDKIRTIELKKRISNSLNLTKSNL